MSCWLLVFLYFSACIKRHTQLNPDHPCLCLSVRQAASVPGLHAEGGRTEPSRHGPGHATTHQGGTRHIWQPDDTCFCVSYHFTNHLHFIYVRLGTPTQSVRPVGLVRLRVKLAGNKASWWNPPVRGLLTTLALQIKVERQPYYSMFHTANGEANVTWYPRMPFVVITAVVIVNNGDDNAWCSVSALSFVVLPKQGFVGRRAATGTRQVSFLKITLCFCDDLV